MTLEDVANIATIAGGTAVVFAVVQVFQSRKQLKADHERSRREKSTELLLEWSKSLNENGSLARKIVESLSEDETRNLCAMKKTRIGNTQKGLLALIFDPANLIEDNGNIVLTEAQASKIRWIVISYLNMLESILVAWQYSIVDRDIIERQFAYLFAPEQGHYALDKFRTAAGGENTYPAIAIFAHHLEVQRGNVLIQKANVA